MIKYIFSMHLFVFLYKYGLCEFPFQKMYYLFSYFLCIRYEEIYVGTITFIPFDQIALMFYNLVIFLILLILLSIYFVFPYWHHKPHYN